MASLGSSRVTAQMAPGRRSRATSSRDDAEDFRQLFEATRARVVRTVWYVVHDDEVAQEITQEAFLALFRHWRKVRSYDRPDLWVRRVALQKAQREAARMRRRDHLERTANPPPGPDALPDPELLDAIGALSPRQRAVVVLFYLEDRPMEEVADLVGCSTSTGFVHLHKARRRLAELLSRGGRQRCRLTSASRRGSR